MLNKNTFIKRTIIGVCIFAVMIGMILLDIFLHNPIDGSNPTFVSGRTINFILISFLILATVVEMRRALGKERIPDCFSWILWAYGVGLGVSYILFGFTGIVFFTLLIFAASVITALVHNRFDSVIYIAFMLVYPGLIV